MMRYPQRRLEPRPSSRPGETLLFLSAKNVRRSTAVRGVCIPRTPVLRLSTRCPVPAFLRSTTIVKSVNGWGVPIAILVLVLITGPSGHAGRERTCRPHWSWRPCKVVLGNHSWSRRIEKTYHLHQCIFPYHDPAVRIPALGAVVREPYTGIHRPARLVV